MSDVGNDVKCWDAAVQWKEPLLHMLYFDEHTYTRSCMAQQLTHFVSISWVVHQQLLQPCQSRRIEK